MQIDTTGANIVEVNNGDQFIASYLLNTGVYVKDYMVAFSQTLGTYYGVLLTSNKSFTAFTT